MHIKDYGAYLCPLCKLNYANMQDNHVNMALIYVNMHIIYIDMLQNNVDMDELHVNIIRLHVDIIYLACKGSKVCQHLGRMLKVFIFKGLLL